MKGRYNFFQFINNGVQKFLVQISYCIQLWPTLFHYYAQDCRQAMPQG